MGAPVDLRGRTVPCLNLCPAGDPAFRATRPLLLIVNWQPATCICLHSPSDGRPELMRLLTSQLPV